MPEIGDFSVPEVALDAAQDEHFDRSERARANDAAKRAAVTTDFPEWADNPDELDFPGIDTPSTAPDVLPKDLTRRKTSSPDTTARARGDEPAETMQATTADVRKTELSNRDVSLAPDEAFSGVGAVGMASEGVGNIPVTDDTARFDADPREEAREIDEIAAQGPQPTGNDDLTQQVPNTLPGGFERAETERQESTSFTQVVFRRDSEIPGVDDVVGVQETDNSRRVFAGTDQPGDDNLTRARSFDAGENLLGAVEEAAQSVGPDDGDGEQTTDPFLSAGDPGGGTLDDLDTEVDEQERAEIMTPRGGRR